MIRKLLCLLAVLLLFGVASAGDLQPNVTSFYYNITAAMGTQTDYQVKFILSNSSGVSGYYAPDNVIYTNGTTRADWYDVNATDASDAPLPFWIENNTQTAYNATAWVKVPTVAAGNTSQGKWRHGNSSQSASTANGYNTASLYFTDYLGAALNTSQETNTGGTVTVSGGIVTLTGATTTNCFIRSLVQIPINYTIESRTKTDHSGATASLQEWFGFRADVPDVRISVMQFAYPSDSNTIRNYNGASTYAAFSGWSSGAYKRLTIKRNLTGSTVQIDGGTQYSNTGTYSTAAENVTMGVYDATAQEYNDWVFVRKSLDTEPTTSLYTTTSGAAPTPSVAAFSCSPTSVTLGSSMTCTDASTNTPTSWIWVFGDGNTSTSQNPSHTYPAIGSYEVDLWANNTAGGDWENKSAYITVSNASGFTQQDLFQEGQYSQTFMITDSVNGAPIPVVVITDSDGQSYTTTNGTGYLTWDAGVHVAYFAASGYSGVARSYLIDDDATHTVQMTASSGSSSSQSVPVYVGIHFVEGFGSPVSGVAITAVPYTTSTSSFAYLASLLGIPLEQAPMENQTMTQVSGTDGKGAFYVLPTTQYNFTFTKTGYTFNPPYIFTAFKNEQDLYVAATSSTTSTLFPNGGQDVNDAIRFNVTSVKVNATAFFLNMTYNDSTSTTTGGTIRVIQQNNTPYQPNTTIATWDITSSSCSNSTLVIHSQEANGEAYANITTTQFGTLYKTFSYSMRGQPVSFMGFGPEIALLFALFIMMMTVMLGTAQTSRQVTFGGLAFEGWVFYAIGWFDSLAARFPGGSSVGEPAILLSLIIVTVISLFSLFEMRKKKEKY